jgi:hypothetical protein
MAEETPTGGKPGGEGEGEKPKKHVTCEFCESRIAPASGDVITLSDKAKKYRDLSEENQVLKQKLAKAESDYQALAESKTPPDDAPKKYEGPERRKRKALVFGERRKVA